MSLSITVTYNDPARPPADYPFSFQSEANHFWWPVAKKLYLSMLQRIECLVITEKDEAKQFILELIMARDYLQSSQAQDISLHKRKHLTERTDHIIMIIRATIEEWANVKDISI